ncbi:MAG: hypothetical protein H6Q05_4907 [Acidobacteria bacterium]|nr:hypothetical protein [Acidobacteriota bacterium]
MQTTLKGSCRTAQGASPGKKHASSHPANHPRSDPERVEQEKPARAPWRHGSPGCQPGKAEAACAAHSGRTSGPAIVPGACAPGCPAGPLRGPLRFPDLVRFLTAGKTTHPRCQVWATARTVRGRPDPRLPGAVYYYPPFGSRSAVRVSPSIRSSRGNELRSNSLSRTKLSTRWLGAMS